ncbi:MAG: tRNA glutamyl-Q(34) synthetase GluQRS [Hyphomicrobiales bacterium]|nr:tRNA glutamyl-Q(34) synthetase GluQRS [Hyphomicrobiales bacterium]
MTDRPVFRFAPSPNGELHLGHAWSALVTHDAARAAGGRFLLRIEDIDIARCRREFEIQILDDLAWLGLTWEESVRRQSDHFDTYAQALEELHALGLLYPCFASRKEIAEAVVAGRKPHPLDPEGAPIYPGLCKALSADEIRARKERAEPFALRLDMARAIAVAGEKTGGDALTFTEVVAPGTECVIAADPARWGDAVIARKDVPASYHLAVVVDDAHQGVTHVTRGRDLYAATDLQRLLQVLLGLPEPFYHHHALVTDDEGRKLSKSHNDQSLAALRKQGLTPADIRRLASEAQGAHTKTS